MQEKTVVLAVAQEVRRRLNDRGVKVILTRDDDRFVPLEARPRIADDAGADLFVSIHADAAPARSANGHTCYVARGAGGASAEAARCIDRRLAGKGIASRGVRQADYRVLVHAACPAVLVEIGYMSNYSEAGRLATAEHRDAVADAIAEGILEALSQRASSATGQ
jgi:N-acetylmuramoyl-L-alanine amidase